MSIATTATVDPTVHRMTQHLRDALHRADHDESSGAVISVIRGIKNATIGNRSRKIGFLSTGIISDLTRVMNGTAASDDLLIQTSATVGSLFNVPLQQQQQHVSSLEATVAAVVEAEQPPPLVPREHVNGALVALVNHIAHDNLKVVESVVRSLKIMYENVSQLRDPQNTLSIAGDRNVVAKLMDFLESPSHRHPGDGRVTSSNTLNELTATLIAHACSSQAHQNMVASCGGVHKLSQLLFSSYPRAQEAALEALSSLCNDNRDTSLHVVSNENTIAQIIALLKSKKTKTRLLAVNCMANINGSLSQDVLKEHLRRNEIRGTVLPAMLKLLSSFETRSTSPSSPPTSSGTSTPSREGALLDSGQGVTLQSCQSGVIREEAPRILAKLIENSRELQQAACESNTITRLSSILQSDNLSDTSREHTLRALAALCSHTEEARKLVIESKALSQIVRAMKSPNAGLQEAACLCSRGLSRAKRQTRIFMLDAGFVEPLVRFLITPNSSSEQERSAVQSTKLQAIACASVGNLVLDFSPVKALIVEHSGCMDTIVAMTRSTDREMRVNSLALLKNLLNKARNAIKEAVLQKITGEYLVHLLRDPDNKVQEQAFAIMRNLAYGSSHVVDALFQSCGKDLMNAIEIVLGSAQGNVQVLIQAIYLLSNISVASAAMRETIMKREIIEKIITLVPHENPEVRVAVLFTIGNLTWEEDAQVGSRVQYFRNAGVETQIQRLLEHEMMGDVRTRSKQVLEQLNTTAPAADTGSSIQ